MIYATTDIPLLYANQLTRLRMPREWFLESTV